MPMCYNGKVRDFEVSFEVVAGRWMLNRIEYEVRKYARSLGLKVDVYEARGLIRGRAMYVLKGRGTDEFSQSVKDDVDAWQRKVAA